MKKDKIEELYGQLDGFSKQPPEELWDNIEAKIGSKKKRRGFVFWIGSAAAVLLILLGLLFFNLYYDNQNPQKNSIITEDSKENDSNIDSRPQPTDIFKESEIRLSENDTLKVNKPQNKKNQRNIGLKSTTKSKENSLVNKGQLEENSGIQIAENGQTLDKTEKLNQKNIRHKNVKDKVSFINKEGITIVENNVENNEEKNNLSVITSHKFNKNDSISSPTNDKFLKDIALEETIENEPKDGKKAKPSWLLEVLGGVSNTASESVIQNSSVQTSAQNDLVYSLKLGYAVSDRWTIKMGVGNNILGQEVNNLSFASVESGFNAEISQNIINNENIILLVSPENLSNDFSTASGLEFDQGSFTQEFYYLQIPLELSYGLIKEDKFNLSIGFGGNINFLTGNTAFINNENIGENINVNSTLFGASLNTNLSYDLSKKINVFVEPNYNYFQKPVDNVNQDFRNTQLRFLFGIQYKLK